MSNTRVLRRRTGVRCTLGLAVALAVGGGWLPGGTGAARALAEGNAGKPAALTNQQRDQIQKLSRAAQDSTKDSAAVVASVRELHGLVATLGDPARGALRDTLRTLLGRDRSVLERAAGVIGDVGKLAGFEKELDDLRASAKANIAKLAHDETIKIAHENQKKLAAMLASSKTVNEVRLAVTEVLARRPEWLSMYREVAPATDTHFKEADEAKLADQAEKMLGMSAATAAAVPPFDADHAKPPEDPAQRAVWFYRACRQIEKYNEGLIAAGVASAEEAADLRIVNTYRESLGILPYELDARLVQAARRHSKEMVDLKYFAHVSPTASEKDFGMRERNAGYKQASAENIAAGVSDGEGVFWLWFDSPGHHKNIAAEGNVALGVGRWQNDWTQDMGRGSRLMFLSEEQRKAVEVKGSILAADKAAGGGGEKNAGSNSGGKRGK